MNNEIIYRYQLNKYLIKPFLIAHTETDQNTLLAAPYEAYSKSSKFLEFIYCELPERYHNNIFMRAAFNNDLKQSCIYVTFLTNLKDMGGRSGVYLTIGILCNPKILKKSKLIQLSLLNCIKTFDMLFNIKLMDNGATTFIQYLKNNEKKEFLKERIGLFCKIIGSLVSSFVNTTLENKDVESNLKNKQTQIHKSCKPKFILYSADINNNELLFNLFLHYIAIYPEKRTNKIDINTNSIFYDVKTMGIPKFPVNINDVELLNYNKINYICIY